MGPVVWKITSLSFGAKKRLVGAPTTAGNNNNNDNNNNDKSIRGEGGNVRGSDAVQARTEDSPADDQDVDPGVDIDVEADIDLDVHLDANVANDKVNHPKDKTKNDNGTPNDNTDDDGKSKVIATFKEAGITLDQESIDQLPTWSQIKQVVGEYPVLYNLDKACPAFRSSVEPVERMIGCSGMFNSGTNLVTQLLKQNCRIPERVAKYGLKGPFHDAQGKPIGPKEAHGMRWQVPWGKHVPANYKEEHATKHATHIAKDGILTAVTIRHPYSWMKSMCKNDYTARWSRGNKCPHLGDEDHDHVPLTIKYDGQVDHHDSLAHLWNDWYAKYWKDADFPYVMVRFEDIIFHPKNVTTQLCECAGGKIIDDQPFQYIVDTAKEGPGHGRLRERTGMVAAWIKYSQPLAPDGGFSGVDYQKSKEFLDQDLMDIFHYRHAPPLGGSGT